MRAASGNLDHVRYLKLKLNRHEVGLLGYCVLPNALSFECLQIQVMLWLASFDVITS